MCNVPRELEVLFLVFADRDVRGLVRQDVCRHQVGICIKADRRVFAVFAGFFLELGHPVQPAEPCDAVENPGKLRVRGNLALIENDAAFGIDPGGQKGRRHLAGVRHQILRFLPYGDGVQIYNAIDAFIITLQADEIPDRAQIITEMKVPRRLHAGKDPVHLVVLMVDKSAGYRVNAMTGQAYA